MRDLGPPSSIQKTSGRGIARRRELDRVIDAFNGGRPPMRTANGLPDPSGGVWVLVRLSAPSSSPGGAGDKVTPCSFKYKVADIFGNVLLGSDTSPVDVEMQREAGKKQRAKIGILVYDVDNKWKLWWCDEVDDVGDACT